MKEQDRSEWTALQYVLGELDCEEQYLWEQQLAHDQGARELVAETVELLECIGLAEAERSVGGEVCPPTVLPDAPTHAPRSVLWTAAAGAGLALALAFLVLLLPAPKYVGGDMELPAEGLGAIEQVAVAWGENHELTVDPLWPSEQLEYAPDDGTTAEADPEFDLTGIGSGSWIKEAVWGLVENRPAALSSENRVP